MRTPSRLPASSLYRACEPESLPFESTETLEDIDAIELQARAREALDFGIGIRHGGYNIFALGPPGTGKFTTVRGAVEDASREQPVPSDWCYVNNFADPKRPVAIALPPGLANALRRDMRQFVDELSTTIPAVFDNDDTHGRLEQIEEEFRERRSAALEELRREAAEKGIAVLETPAGFTFVPMLTAHDVMTPEQFQKLSDEEKARIQQAVTVLQERLQKLLRQFQGWRKEARENVKKLHREIAEMAVGQLVDDLRERYREHEKVIAYLAAVQENVVENVNDFMPQPELPFGLPAMRGDPAERYQVNVIVDNSECEGAPVIHEPLPNLGNVLGRCEHQAMMGTLVTNFTLIKPGALHKANGGYLLLDARQLILQPFAWEMLKRALKAREISIESLERSLSLVSTVALEPEPIPLDAKVILVGERMLYYLLGMLDPEFPELFKVAVDFDTDIDRDDQGLAAYSRLIATLGRRHAERPLERGAVARVIEQGTRRAGRSAKLSTLLEEMAELLDESDHFASRRGASSISRDDVQAALDARERRLDRMQQRLLESIERGEILIDTSGEVVGQVNGLAVIELGDLAFGHPVRITATTRLGEGEVVDIEREIEMGGPIHSKGVMILSSFLMARYARSHPVSVSASVVFEQSYSDVEGDSASLAELSALLSSLAGAPIRQSIAITGSVNQHGQAQPIGGVNEKIEGFFDVCSRRGLDGSHAVIIPSANVGDLMLRADVVEAVEQDLFAVHAVASADEAIELLTGVEAGAPDADGAFPDGSLNARVDAALVAMAKLKQEHDRAGKGEEHGSEHGDDDEQA